MVSEQMKVVEKQFLQRLLLQSFPWIQMFCLDIVVMAGLFCIPNNKAARNATSVGFVWGFDSDDICDYGKLTRPLL